MTPIATDSTKQPQSTAVDTPQPSTSSAIDDRFVTTRKKAKVRVSDSKGKGSKKGKGLCHPKGFAPVNNDVPAAKHTKSKPKSTNPYAKTAFLYHDFSAIVSSSDSDFQ